MTRRHRPKIFLGDAPIHDARSAGAGDWVERDGERYYRIANYHSLPPFFMSVVSAHDHWLFISTTGGLTCGRRDPGNALFPYYTDDKIHDACATTGPKTVFRIVRDGRTSIWQPFASGPLVYDLERHLYKNVSGNKLAFEEVNHDLGLTFAYTWTTGDRFGFVRRSQLLNTGEEEVRIELLDGLRNLLPYGVERAAQTDLSTLVDAYKQAELVEDACAGIFTLSSILTDRAEPNEALKATVVWSTGLEDARVLLSEDQVPTFCAGEDVHPEAFKKGKRGAFFLRSDLTLAPGTSRDWHLLADVEQGPSQLATLLPSIRGGITTCDIERDVEASTARLEHLVRCADGRQRSADELVNSRHYSNTLFNIMRGGVFPHDYSFPRADFLEFLAVRNRPLRERIEAELGEVDTPLTLVTVLEIAERTNNTTLARLAREYLPLTFSRRHGDPSRPWNHFSIELENADGSEYLNYQGNWRDIFQNWEALALSFPEYIESFVAKFVNASTADGYNPYRISRDGLEWEVPQPGVSWSNIGYWGDHQIGYLTRLLELSRAYHPGKLAAWFEQEGFVYADVPYRIKPYRDLLRRPRETIDYDEAHAESVARRVAAIGTDGKLVTLACGTIYQVNVLEKLLLAALVRIGSLVPGGGIWMNTQRPEWNDANNALVGHGLSMVTLCYLRRYLCLFHELLQESPATSFDVSREVDELLRGVVRVLEEHRPRLDKPFDAATRKSFMDGMGAINDRHRAQVYDGLSGNKASTEKVHLQQMTELAVEYLDHSIANARRADGLFHAYNLIQFDTSGFEIEPLDEMLEGQVAVLSSGFLDSDSAVAVLDALRASRLYRDDQNSYILYPNRKLPSFFDKNVIPSDTAKSNVWIRSELDAGRTDYVERDVDGHVHFNGVFRNATQLRAALEADPTVDARHADELCDIYESVFEHRRFTGRSGAMYKYEGLGCIYWHMVSKLLLATGEVVSRAVDEDPDSSSVARLGEHFREIQAGLGLHKSPAAYGAFPFDPYSHTPEFIGVQQPGLTGQVKEDVITRFWQLGVRVKHGEIAFEPTLLERREFLEEAASWNLDRESSGQTESLPAGSLAFTLCGVLVIYRIADSPGVQVFGDDEAPTVLPGSRLGPELSQSLFRREGRVRKIIVNVPQSRLDLASSGELG